MLILQKIVPINFHILHNNCHWEELEREQEREKS